MARTTGTASLVQILIMSGEAKDLAQAKSIAEALPDGPDKVAIQAAIAKAEAKK